MKSIPIPSCQIRPARPSGLSGSHTCIALEWAIWAHRTALHAATEIKRTRLLSAWRMELPSQSAPGPKPPRREELVLHDWAQACANVRPKRRMMMCKMSPYVSYAVHVCTCPLHCWKTVWAALAPWRIMAPHIPIYEFACGMRQTTRALSPGHTRSEKDKAAIARPRSIHEMTCCSVMPGFVNLRDAQ